jgi:carboxyl-terminal processing protease
MRYSRLAVLTAAALLAFVLPVSVSSQTANNSDTYEQLRLFGDVFERVRSDYVEETTDEQLIENAINGMLTSLDPHSSYLNAKNFEDMQVQTKGEFGGLGIEVTMENGVVKVVSPIDDTPAARAGIQPGDFIIELDGQAVMGLTLNQAVDKMRGPINSNIELTIQRGDQEPFKVKLARAVIKIQSVRARLEGDIAYLRVTSFSEQTDSGLESNFKKLKDQANGKLAGIVLDLRNNPGGLLDQAVAVSDSFLDKGEIVSTRGRHPEDAQRYNARAGDIADGLPMVVLINGGSASASEIVAGALKDHRRAIILGTKSFGKGSVQTIIPVPGHGAIRLTTARYYTPSGRSIQALGIEPDIEVQQARVQVIDQGHRPSEAELPGALRNDNGDSDNGDSSSQQKKPDTGADAGKPPEGTTAPTTPATPGTTETTTPRPPASTSDAGEEKPEDQDYQLSRALDLLRGIALFRTSQLN